MASLASKLRGLRTDQAAETLAVVLALSVGGVAFYQEIPSQKKFGSEAQNHIAVTRDPQPPRDDRQIDALAMRMGLASGAVLTMIAGGMNRGQIEFLVGQSIGGNSRERRRAMERLGMPVPENKKKKNEEERKDRLVVAAPLGLLILAGWNALIMLPALLLNGLRSMGRSRRNLNKLRTTEITPPQHMIVIPHPHPLPPPMLTLDYV